LSPDLPFPALAQIALSVGYHELPRLCQVAKWLEEKVCRNDEFWHLLYQQDFVPVSSTHVPDIIDKPGLRNRQEWNAYFTWAYTRCRKLILVERKTTWKAAYEAQRKEFEQPNSDNAIPFDETVLSMAALDTSAAHIYFSNTGNTQRQLYARVPIGSSPVVTPPFAWLEMPWHDDVRANPNEALPVNLLLNAFGTSMPNDKLYDLFRLLLPATTRYNNRPLLNLEASSLYMAITNKLPASLTVSPLLYDLKRLTHTDNQDLVPLALLTEELMHDVCNISVVISGQIWQNTGEERTWVRLMSNIRLRPSEWEAVPAFLKALQARR
jgi:hypothetical protein